MNKRLIGLLVTIAGTIVTVLFFVFDRNFSDAVAIAWLAFMVICSVVGSIMLGAGPYWARVMKGALSGWKMIFFPANVVAVFVTASVVLTVALFFPAVFGVMSYLND
ncbi:MAG: hypothetical protein IJR00_02255 [Lachnospiraceae bacterium]|nr:hypothetical protein [Lachnospiraceae bacterium]